MESRRTKNEENKPLMYLPFILLLKNIHLLKADSKYSLTETIYYENIAKLIMIFSEINMLLDKDL